MRRHHRFKVSDQRLPTSPPGRWQHHHGDYGRRARGLRHDGFTLPEVLCAMTLLVVGAFSSFALIALGVQCDKEAADFSTARTIATTQIEALRASQNRPTAGSTTISGITTSLGGGATGTTVVTRQESTGQTALDLVTVTISWTEPGRGTVTLKDSTYICSGGVSTS